ICTNGERRPQAPQPRFVSQPNRLRVVEPRYLSNRSSASSKAKVVSSRAVDNRLNEKRQQIAELRAEMHAVENQMRLQIFHDLEYGEIAYQLIDMRKKLVRSIRERNELGGVEVCLPYRERFIATTSRISNAAVTFGGRS